LEARCYQCHTERDYIVDLLNFLPAFNKSEKCLTVIKEPCGIFFICISGGIGCAFSIFIIGLPWSSKLMFKNTTHLYAVSPHMEWKPKSVSPSSISHGVTAAPPAAPSPVDDGSTTEVSALSKKLSHANVSHEHVIIPEHIRIPDSERTHFIFGSFESEIDPKASLAASYDIVAKEDLNDHSPSRSEAFSTNTL